MKAIILLVVALIFLGGAGYGGWMLYQIYIVGEEPAEPPPPPPPPTQFVRLQSMVIPLVGEKRVEQFITVVVTLEVLAEKQPDVSAQTTRIVDSFITTLYGAVDRKEIFIGNLVSIPAVKQKLMEASEKMFGKGVVRDILVQIVMQRNL